MSSLFFLAWRYVLYNRLKSAVLVASLAITSFVPLALYLLVSEYDTRLIERAVTTPLVLGAKGNRFDLILQALYFRENEIDPVDYGLVDELVRDRLAAAIPLHCRYSAASFPIVGTSLEYFTFRELVPERGALPALLGEAVIGSRVAAELKVGTGDHLLPDQRNIYDLSQTFPLKLRVAGVLASTGSADDAAIFVDVKTAWILDGFGHGHQDVTEEGADGVLLERSERSVTANAALATWVEITPENIDSFHFHGDRDKFPLSSIVVVPAGAKGRTILLARWNARETVQLLVPEDVVRDLMGIVFRIKTFFDANFALVNVSTVLFIVLVIVLSLRLRREERATLHKLGGGRWIVFWLQSCELLILGAVSLAVAGVLAFLLRWLAPDIFRIL